MDDSSNNVSKQWGRRIQLWFAGPFLLLTLATLVAFTLGSRDGLHLILVTLSVLTFCLLFVIFKLTKMAISAGGSFRQSLLITSDSEVSVEFEKLINSLFAVTRHTDPVFRELALAELSTLSHTAACLGKGKISFHDTETWRIAYDRLLRSSGLHLYRSVAWIRHPGYWRDFAGQHSMATNFELVEDGRLSISRICILDDQLWTPDSLPENTVHNWLADQHFRGITISLVRQSEIEQEPELLVDYGIYGYRAVGTQETDENGLTTEFQLSFDLTDIQRYEQIWERLQIYSKNFGQLLDRTGVR